MRLKSGWSLVKSTTPEEETLVKIFCGVKQDGFEVKTTYNYLLFLLYQTKF